MDYKSGRQRRVWRAAALLAVLTLSACSDETPVASKPAPAQEKGVAPQAAKVVEATVVVPSEVQGSWSGVEVAIIDREGRRRQQTVELGTRVELAIAGLALEAGPFLPAFMSDNNRITSLSNEPDNPAVMVRLYRDGQLLNSGWVFRDLPQFNTLVSHWLRLELVRGVPADGADSE